MRLLILLFLFIPVLSTKLLAQADSKQEQKVEAFLLTVGPGELLYERFGHSAIFFAGAGLPKKSVYSFGLFDFNQPNFTANFLKGRWIYGMSLGELEETIWAYTQVGRKMWVQSLDLSPERAIELEAKIRKIYHSEERNYRYDYYYANCSTKIRDLIDEATEGQMKAQFEAVQTKNSYRWQTFRMLEEFYWTRLGMTILMGQTVDKPLNVWQAMFIPMEMQQWLVGMQLEDPSGESKLLVQNNSEAQPPGAFNTPSIAPEGESLSMLAYSLGIALVFVVLTLLSAQSMITRVLSILMLTSYILFAASFAFLIPALWFFTDHWAASYNENLIQFSPLWFALGFVMLVRPLKKHSLILARLIAGLALVGLAIKSLSFFFQDNWQVMALNIPACLAILFYVEINTRRSNSEPTIESES